MQITTGQVQTIIALFGLLFAIMVAILGFIVRATIKWAAAETNLGALQRSLENLVTQQAKAWESIYTAMREDRAAANERLLYLERRNGVR
jgi:hypothetical protein